MSTSRILSFWDPQKNETNAGLVFRAAVSIGELDDRSDPDCAVNFCAPKMLVIPIKEAISHSGFASHGFFNDIALVRLRSKITFNSKLIFSEKKTKIK